MQTLYPFKLHNNWVDFLTHRGLYFCPRFVV
nr:MAG TPA: hypothetical protein [Caudoviricetes sp.]